MAPERELPALDSPERWYRRPTLGVSLAARTSSVRTPAIADELAEPERRPELHGLALKGQQAWAAHLGSLLYPPGHPEQGRWRDSVSLEQAVEAQVAYWREMLPPGHLDEPKLHFVGKIDHGLLNQRIRSWDQTSVESSREFYDWLQAQPLDPKAYPARLWLPADPHDPDVTTRGEDMARRIRETERVNFPEDADGS